ncbi:unnamed protein product [Brassica oleracea]|uniref:Uncharacterized protein n=1 Tax=Brassica oleracea TaxID=3712 RepID=A0A3P6GSI0_BRAOL|nr:unnamed protein product [Brassica oleracea]
MVQRMVVLVRTTRFNLPRRSNQDLLPILQKAPIALQDMPYSLLREFRVKWLGKYNIDRCSLGNIQKYFQIVNKTKTAIQTISKSTHLLNPSQISQTNPNSQTHKRPTSSPTSSTTSSSSQKSSRKEKMKTFLAEMLAQFEAENSDIEESNQQVNDTQAEDPYGVPLGHDPFG